MTQKATAMRITIKLKLAVTFAAVVLLAGAMAWLAISSLGSLNVAMDDLIKGPMQRIQLENELENDLLRIVPFFLLAIVLTVVNIW